MLFFLHWLEEPGVPRVSDILLSSTRNIGFGSSARYEPCQTTDLSYYLFPLTGGEPHFRFGVPANHLASLSPLPVSGDLRYYLPTPPLGQDMTQGQFLSGV